MGRALNAPPFPRPLYPLYSPVMHLRFVAATDQGRVRARNENRFVADREFGFFAVIDGMGGHAGGELAACTIAEAASAFIKETAVDSDKTWPAGLDPRALRAGESSPGGRATWRSPLAVDTRSFGGRRAGRVRPHRCGGRPDPPASPRRDASGLGPNRNGGRHSGNGGPYRRTAGALFRWCARRPDR